jgi:hypothetical protein
MSLFAIALVFCTKCYLIDDAGQVFNSKWKVCSLFLPISSFRKLKFNDEKQMKKQIKTMLLAVFYFVSEFRTMFSFMHQNLLRSNTRCGMYTVNSNKKFTAMMALLGSFGSLSRSCLASSSSYALLGLSKMHQGSYQSEPSGSYTTKSGIVVNYQIESLVTGKSTNGGSCSVQSEIDRIVDLIDEQKGSSFLTSRKSI